MFCLKARAVARYSNVRHVTLAYTYMNTDDQCALPGLLQELVRQMLTIAGHPPAPSLSPVTEQCGVYCLYGTRWCSPRAAHTMISFVCLVLFGHRKTNTAAPFNVAMGIHYVNLYQARMADRQQEERERAQESTLLEGIVGLVRVREFGVPSIRRTRFRNIHFAGIRVLKGIGKQFIYLSLERKGILEEFCATERTEGTCGVAVRW